MPPPGMTMMRLPVFVWMALITNFLLLFALPIIAVALGVALGGFVQFAFQLPSFFRNNYDLRPDFGFGHPGLKKMSLLVLPATMGMAVAQINIFVSTILASYLPQGSITYLYYSMRLIQFPVGIFGVAMGMAALPALSEHAPVGIREQRVQARRRALERSEQRVGALVDGARAAVGEQRILALTRADQPGEVGRRWFVMDASDEVLGRLATRAATVIRGKHKPPFTPHLDVGDFVVYRADGQFAYQLAAVVDDAEQGVTDVVRGADLLDSTPRQLYLQQLLRYPQPRYLHFPVAVNAAGEKLSKQTGALPLANGTADLRRALSFLGQPQTENLAEAVGNWRPSFIARRRVLDAAL